MNDENVGTPEEMYPARSEDGKLTEAPPLSSEEVQQLEEASARLTSRLEDLEQQVRSQDEAVQDSEGAHPVLLSRHAILLDRYKVVRADGVLPALVSFLPEDWEEQEMGAGTTWCYQMGRQGWDDMGQPDQITVVVEPGDRLNEEPTSRLEIVHKRSIDPAHEGMPTYIDKWWVRRRNLGNFQIEWVTEDFTRKAAARESVSRNMKHGEEVLEVEWREPVEGIIRRPKTSAPRPGVSSRGPMDGL